MRRLPVPNRGPQCCTYDGQTAGGCRRGRERKDREKLQDKRRRRGANSWLSLCDPLGSLTFTLAWLIPAPVLPRVRGRQRSRRSLFPWMVGDIRTLRFWTVSAPVPLVHVPSTQLARGTESAAHGRWQSEEGSFSFLGVHPAFSPLSIFSAGHVVFLTVLFFLYKYCWNTPSDISAPIGSRSVAPIDY